MSLVYADRIKETTITTGTGTYTLAGASSGFRTFLAGIANGNTCYYCCENGTDWEVGLGTLSGGTSLARTTIVESSNAGSAVSWGAGSKVIFVVFPASKVVTADTTLTENVLPRADAVGDIVDSGFQDNGTRGKLTRSSLYLGGDTLAIEFSAAGNAVLKDPSGGNASPMLQFGGSGSTFAGLKRSSDGFAIRNAADSGYTDLFARIVYIGSGSDGMFKSTGVTLPSSGQFMFVAGSNATASADTGLARLSAGVVKSTNGSTGFGDHALSDLLGYGTGTTYRTKLDFGTPAADVTISVPNTAGTMALTSDVRATTGHMSGLRVSYVSATSVLVATGKCRDSTDTYDLTLAAEKTPAITTAGAAEGLDETTLSATATTSGSTQATMTASLWVETPMTATVRSISGTIAGAATTITGTSTKFLTECAIGDVLRSASAGARRITAIASDTSLTIVSAFNADPSGTAATLYENLTFWCDTAQAADKRAVDTVSHDGLTITWTTNSTSNGAGKTAKVGVEVVSRWYYPWVVYGGSGTTVILSTQRTRPYGVTGYTTSWRRLNPAVNNNASGDIQNFSASYIGGSCRVWLRFAFPARVLSAGAATSWTAVVCSEYVPPTAALIDICLTTDYVSSNPDLYVADMSSTANFLVLRIPTSAIFLPTFYGLLANFGQAVQYQLSGAGGRAYLDIFGWWEGNS